MTEDEALKLARECAAEAYRETCPGYEFDETTPFDADDAAVQSALLAIRRTEERCAEIVEAHITFGNRKDVIKILAAIRSGGPHEQG